MAERILHGRNLDGIEPGQSLENKNKVVFRDKEFPSLGSNKGIVSFPFYNESEVLPSLMQQLTFSSNSSEIYLIGVDHKSSDYSQEIVYSYKNLFGKTVVIEDNFPGREPAVPRKTGLDLSYLISQTTNNSKTPLATLDSDVNVPKEFISEILSFTNTHDALVFPMRNQQNLLRDCINAQGRDIKGIAIHSLLGSDWISFNLRYALLKAGCIEPNGGGFAITSEAYKKVGGFQPAFAPTGEIVLGANTEFGIKLQKYGIKTKISPYISHVSPRRVISSLKGVGQSGGYSITSSGAVGFLETQYENNEYPLLTGHQWQEYLNKQIRRTFDVILSRAVIKGKLNNFRELFPGNQTWQNMLTAITDTYERYKYMNSELYNQSIQGINQSEYDDFLKYIEYEWIPTNDQLLNWSEEKIDLVDNNIARLRKD